MPSATALDKARVDFRAFLYLIWKHLGLPDPTPVQYQIANYLQHGPRRKVIEAFRGIGKSWITSAFVLWCLWNDNDLRVLVLSASKERSDAFSIFTKRLLGEVPWLSHLAPDPRSGDRDSNVAFDVHGASAAHAPSVKSVGITGQVTGSRAGLIVCDDVEVPNNSETATQREKLVARCAELGGAVLSPDAEWGVVFLGTPQVEDTLYEQLTERGYDMRVWPAEMPVEVSKYKGRMSPGILNTEIPPGTATDPLRFDKAELAERRIEFGAAGYALQFMLDTDISAENRHPLKTKDFVVTDIDVDVAADFYVWSGGEEQTLEHLPRVGLAGDRFQKPLKISDGFSPYTDTIMYVDPSGRGKDQTAYAILKTLNGMLFLYDWSAFQGGYDTPTLTKLATIARDAKCTKIVVEDNFGNGMYAELLRPIVGHVFNPQLHKVKKKDGEPVESCAVEDHHVTGHKEARIIETLEPVLSGHRLLIDEALVKRITAAKDRSLDVDASLKSGFFQLTRITQDRGCLRFDDWLDALAGGVAWCQEQVGMDVVAESKVRKEERLTEELERFSEGILGKRPQRTWNSHLTSESP